MSASTQVTIGSNLQPVQKKKANRFLRSLRKFPMVYLGSFLIVFLLLIAILAPWISTHNPYFQFNTGLHQDGTPVGPNQQFIWGADENGRDVFSRVIYGTRVSLQIGFFATFISLVIGTTLGLISGYFGGWVDTLVMRLTDSVLAFPFLLFALALVAIIGPSIFNVYLSIGILGWGTMARVVRGQVLQAKEFEYVQAARALGASKFRIMFRTILPNIWGPVVVLATLTVSQNILTEASLSFLGIGVQQPTASWGNMIQEGLANYQFAPWLMIFPGVALLVAVLGFNLLGDGLRDILDPRNSTH